ncbi:hypothetical protein E6R62_10770, partial [Streptomyces sp. A1136]
CTAGKDRTGWASATLLTALGVPWETVMADHLASNGLAADAGAGVAVGWWVNRRSRRGGTRRSGPPCSSPRRSAAP